jgi:choline dehydrogenase-like flavoprotein
MPCQEKCDIFILGSGAGGKLLARQATKAGRRSAVVERQRVDGSYPNVASMPSKSEFKVPEPRLREAVIPHLTVAERPGFLLASVLPRPDRRSVSKTAA